MSHGGVSSHPYPLSAQICATCILVIRDFHRLSWVQPLKEELQSKGCIWVLMEPAVDHLVEKDTIYGQGAVEAVR